MTSPSVPKEVLIQIFEYLEAPYRLKACLVCKEWLQAVNCPRMLNDVDLFVHQQVLASDYFFSPTRQFCRLIFYAIVIDDRLFEFLNSHREQFVSLTFDKCIIEGYYIKEILPYSNLQSLFVIQCSAFKLFPSLPNLTCLKIWTYLTDNDINMLDQTMPKLEFLELYYRHKTVSCALKDFISKRSSTITTFLHLRDDKSEIAALEIQMKYSNMKKIIMPFSWDEESIEHLRNSQPFLTGLFLAHIRRVEYLRILFRTLTHLEELEVLSCSTLSYVVMDVFQLQHLRKLHLIYCNISASDFVPAIANTKITQLEDLNLSSSEINDESLQQLLKGNPNIQRLNLSRTSVSDATLNMICESHIRLREISLMNCNISDAGLTGKNGTSSKTLNSSKRKDDKCAEAESTKSLSNLKNLRMLNLRSNSLITSEGVIEAIRLPLLKHLDLSDCENLRNVVLAQMIRQNPFIRSISLGNSVFRY